MRQIRMPFSRTNHTYVAILALSNRSLILPPATLKNAELEKPVKKTENETVPEPEAAPAGQEPLKADGHHDEL